MSRMTYVLRDGKLVPKHLAPPKHDVLGNAPAVISDSLSDVLNPVDGKRYDSKSAYYRTVRRAGCEIVGNEDPIKHAGKRPEPRRGEVAEAIKRAMYQHGVG